MQEKLVHASSPKRCSKDLKQLFSCFSWWRRCAFFSSLRWYRWRVRPSTFRSFSVSWSVWLVPLFWLCPHLWMASAAVLILNSSSVIGTPFTRLYFCSSNYRPWTHKFAKNVFSVSEMLKYEHWEWKVSDHRLHLFLVPYVV